MSNNEFYAVCAFIGVLVVIFSFRSYYSIKAFSEYLKYKDVTPSLEKYEGSECIRHTWHNIALAMRPLSTGEYTVCCKCGKVAATDYKLNKPALEVCIRIVNDRLTETLD